MNEQKQIAAEREYLGRSCWKTAGFKTIHTGVIREVRVDNDWVEGKVYWKSSNGSWLSGHKHSWERVSNLGFESLPAFTAQKTRPKGLSPSPFSFGEYEIAGLDRGKWDNQAEVPSHIDSQGIPDEELEQVNKENTSTHTTKQDYKKRSEQPHEANRAINYRALLAMLDQRERDDWHTLQLNQTLKRHNCKPITVKAFKMRANEFEKCFKRIKDRGCRFRMSEFLTEAFNGDGHWSIGKRSLWRRY